MSKEQTLQLIEKHPLLTAEQKRLFRAKVETMTLEEISNLGIVLEANLAYVEQAKKIYDFKIKGIFRNMGNLVIQELQEQTQLPVPKQAKAVVHNYLEEQGKKFIQQSFAQKTRIAAGEEIPVDQPSQIE